MIEQPPGSTNPPNIYEWQEQEAAEVAREARVEAESRRREKEGESDEKCDECGGEMEPDAGNVAMICQRCGNTLASG